MDSYGMFGRLQYLPHARHAKGEMRTIIDGDTHHRWGEIPEVKETYAVMGYINEHQVAIMETTFGGRPELADTTGCIDYVSLMTIALQRSRTAREAISVMTSLTQQYGYVSEGESFSIADTSEVWILEMIGKGAGERGTVWAAIRIPDDCICAHANQSRIHHIDFKDKENVMYSKDVVSFARRKGYFTGKDADFSFADAYAPADFSAIRICEARVWSFFNHFVDGMEKYVPAVDGHHIGEAEPMPLYFKPNRKLSLSDVMNCMRDHFEGTPFALDQDNDPGAGIFNAPYRPTPLYFKVGDKTYFNERPISTQQTASTFVAQIRGWLPACIGGVLWYGNDDPNMVPYTPIYCGATQAPRPYNDPKADDVTFSWNSAFWVCNWVSNMTYPRYSHVFPSVEKERNAIEGELLSLQKTVEAKALELYKQSEAQAVNYLTSYGCGSAERMLDRWKKLGEYIIVKYNDITVKPEKDGKFEMTPDGLAVPPERPGYSEKFRETLVKTTGDRFLVPQK